MVTMLREAFKDDEVRNSLVKLKNNIIIDKVQKHNLNEKYREDVVRIVNDLIKVNKMPKIVVAATNIYRVPRLENICQIMRQDLDWKWPKEGWKV